MASAASFAAPPQPGAQCVTPKATGGLARLPAVCGLRRLPKGPHMGATPTPLCRPATCAAALRAHAKQWSPKVGARRRRRCLPRMLTVRAIELVGDRNTTQEKKATSFAKPPRHPRRTARAACWDLRAWIARRRWTPCRFAPCLRAAREALAPAASFRPRAALRIGQEVAGPASSSATASAGTGPSARTAISPTARRPCAACGSRNAYASDFERQPCRRVSRRPSMTVDRRSTLERVRTSWWVPHVVGTLGLLLQPQPRSAAL
mmetsp:Transcript_68090/g.197197  ORF Transcript_68090/g.197197 Transcript_68090/m.197197 type:complete len:263 (-) Transcript_68090:186-974(-)